jgi:putative ABC transport system permease protein
MRLLAYRAGTAPQQYMSVRALKQRIDQDLRRATLLFSSIPMVAMIVAALGVANLMMANVANRAREIATLRAIGTTKWQVTRLIIGEALVLGSLGAVLGMGLGLHAAGSMRHMTKSIWGYEPVWTMPWDLLIPAIILTLGVCLVAGLLPARHAARSNVIAAMQTT